MLNSRTHHDWVAQLALFSDNKNTTSNQELHVLNQFIRLFNKLVSNSEKYLNLISLVESIKTVLNDAGVQPETKKTFEVWCHENKVLELMKILHFHFMHYSTVQSKNTPASLHTLKTNLAEIKGIVSTIEDKDKHPFLNQINFYLKQIKKETFSDEHWESFDLDLLKFKEVIFERLLNSTEVNQTKLLVQFLQTCESKFYPGYNPHFHPNFCSALETERRNSLEQFALPLRHIVYSFGSLEFNALNGLQLNLFNSRFYTVKNLSSGTNLVYSIKMDNQELIVKIYTNDGEVYPSMMKALTSLVEGLDKSVSSIVGRQFGFRRIVKLVDGNPEERGSIEFSEFMTHGNLEKFVKEAGTSLKTSKRTGLEKYIFDERRARTLLYTSKVVRLIYIFEKLGFCVPDIKPSNFFATLNPKLGAAGEHNEFDLILDPEALDIKFNDWKTVRRCENYPLIGGADLFVTLAYLPPEIDSLELKRNLQVNVTRLHCYLVALTLYEIATGDDDYKFNRDKRAMNFSHQIFAEHPELKEAIEFLFNYDPNKATLKSSLVPILEKENTSTTYSESTSTLTNEHPLRMAWEILHKSYNSLCQKLKSIDAEEAEKNHVTRAEHRPRRRATFSQQATQKSASDSKLLQISENQTPSPTVHSDPNTPLQRQKAFTDGALPKPTFFNSSPKPVIIDHTEVSHSANTTTKLQTQPSPSLNMPGSGNSIRDKVNFFNTHLQLQGGILRPISTTEKANSHTQTSTPQRKEAGLK